MGKQTTDPMMLIKMIAVASVLACVTAMPMATNPDAIVPEGAHTVKPEIFLQHGCSSHHQCDHFGKGNGGMNKYCDKYGSCYHCSWVHQNYCDAHDNDCSRCGAGPAGPPAYGSPVAPEEGSPAAPAPFEGSPMPAEESPAEESPAVPYFAGSPGEEDSPAEEGSPAVPYFAGSPMPEEEGSPMPEMGSPGEEDLPAEEGSPAVPYFAGSPMPEEEGSPMPELGSPVA